MTPEQAIDVLFINSMVVFAYGHALGTRDNRPDQLALAEQVKSESETARQVLRQALSTPLLSASKKAQANSQKVRGEQKRQRIEQVRQLDREDKTPAEIARHLSVNVKTIYRDLEAIRETEG